MTWFHVDDGFWSHPKTIGISLEAVGVWTLAGSWCAQHLTDGYIPADALLMICRRRTPRAAQELVDRNLWIPVADGWQFVDWRQWQRTRSDIEARRRATRERVTRWRERQPP